MSDDNNTEVTWHTGLYARLDTSFPKKCMTCGHVFHTAKQYFTETMDISEQDTGLKTYVADDTSVVVEAFRNCTCGSTLMETFDDHRDELQEASSVIDEHDFEFGEEVADNVGGWDDAWYEGLRSSGGDAFPKECRNCGRIYNTPSDFFAGTADINAKKTGLREIVDEDEGVFIEAFRNCACGSTLMDNFSNRRDTSAAGLQRREKFDKGVKYLVSVGIDADVAYEELLKVVRGEKSEVLARIKPPEVQWEMNGAAVSTLVSPSADDSLCGNTDASEVLAPIGNLAEAGAAERQLELKTRELEAARKQLVQSEKLASIGVLIAGVAHEINNPIAFVTSNLNSLKGYYEDLFSVIDAYTRLDEEPQITSQQLASVMQLKEKLQLEELQQDVRQVLEECTDGLSRVRKIVDNLRDFSRSGDAEWQWTDLHEQLDRTLSVAINEIKYKAQVNTDYGDLPEIQCKPSQINQVFLNLLVNAAQAIEDRGEITIKTRVGSLPKELHEKGARGTVSDGPNAWVCLQISDTGTGIAAETLQQIFDPFFTTKEVGKGTGLGLSVSDGIIQSHGGHIIADSELGAGTTFSIWLPVKQPSV